VIIDYDLTPDPARLANDSSGQADLIRSELRAETAETVAYLGRCYSTCKFIVAVNQIFRRRTFDLTFQKFVESRADLNISQDEIGSAELWTGQGDGYHPWSWPKLIDAGRLFEQRLSRVDLDTPVLPSLGLLSAEGSGLDARQLDALGDRSEQVTFRDVAMSFELGLTGRDEQPDEEALRRIAAAGIGRWLDRMIMPAQNVLIDAPHLVYRIPSLLSGDPASLDAWNSTTGFHESELGLNLMTLDSHRSASAEWFHRPAWAWADIAADVSLPEISSPWGSRMYDFAFAEDMSKFINVSSASEVQTDLAGPYSRRYILRLEDGSVNYVPPRRIQE
jgi:hypothetical protein